MLEATRTKRGRSINHVLIRRLLVTSLLIALLISVTVSLVEIGRVNDIVRDRGIQRAELFAQLASRNNGATLEREMTQRFHDLVAVRLVERMGSVVLADLYSADHRVLASFRDQEYPHLQILTELINNRDVEFSATGNNWSELVNIHGLPHIRVLVPIANEGVVSGYLHGVYAVSQDALDDLEKRNVRTVLTTFLIVLTTTALLYPTILRLMRTLTTFSNYLLESNLEILKVLGSAIAKRDSDTNAHNYRVTILSARLAEAMGLGRSEIQCLIKGAFLHDVGKIAIADDILLKPGRLDEAEFSVMKTHVDHGLDIVRKSFWLEDAAPVVGCHHEKYDGSGYPAGLRGEAIPVTARIFAIVDVFDALVSKRPYKEPFSFADSMTLLRESLDSHFDRAIFARFEGIAEALHELLRDKPELWLENELAEIMEQYFSAELDCWSG